MDIHEIIREKHLFPDKGKTIEPSGGYPWNGWLVYPNGFTEFRTNLWWDYLSHLEKCRLCRERENIPLWWVKQQLVRIEQQWKELMHRA